MSIRDTFPDVDDLVGAIEDIDALQAWEKSAAHAKAPVEVRETVRAYLQRLQADVTGMEWNEPGRADVIAEIERAGVLRSWRDGDDAQGAPLQVGWAIESYLEDFEQLLAETRSTDAHVVRAQALTLAQAFTTHPLREGALARVLAANLSAAHAAARPCS